MGLNFKAALTLTIDNSVSVDLGAPADEFTYSKQFGLAPGTSANQADLLWYDQRTLATVTAENLDLAGVLSDVFGTAFTLARLKGIFITKVSGTGPLQVLGHASAGLANIISDSTVYVSIGDMLAMLDRSATAWAVTATSADLIKINNAGADTVVYDIFLVGSST